MNFPMARLLPLNRKWQCQIKTTVTTINRPDPAVGNPPDRAVTVAKVPDSAVTEAPALINRLLVAVAQVPIAH
jgi:hypothetical protein